MLGTLRPDQKKDWKQFIGPLVHAYNSTRHDTTGISPFALMFGREPRLPIDLAFNIHPPLEKKQPISKYIENLKNKIRLSYDLAQKNIRKSQERQKEHYDMKVRGATVQPGDRVLVKIVAFDGRHKIADRWEEDPYIIISKPNPDIPVFKVKKENGEGRERVLHRNLLFPIGNKESGEHSPQPRPRKEPPKPAPRRTRAQARKESEITTVSEGIDSESDEDIVIVDGSVGVEPTVNNAPTGQHNHENAATESQIEPQNSASESQFTTSESHSGPEPQSEPNGENTSLKEPVPVQVLPSSDEIDLNNSSNDQLDDASQTPGNIESSHTENEPEPQVHGTEQEVQDTEQDVQGSEHDSAEHETPEPRRSIRTKKKPNWMTSGEFQVCSVTNNDWKYRADYLKSLLSSNIVENNTSVTDTFLKLLTWKPD